MKYKKVGLVLGGGGAKGAYQIGVFKALYENNLAKDISLLCGTSIGAINCVLFTTKDIDKMTNVWLNLNKDKILMKKKFSEYFDLSKLKSISIYSRQGFLNLLDEHIDLDDVSNNSEIYVVATPIRNQYAQTVFKLHGEDPDTIKNILLATSAIPGIFEAIKIKGVYYMDGYRISNVPTHIAVTKGCDLVFVVPLGKKDNPDANSFPNTTIIDFKHPSFENLSFSNGTLGFDSKFIEERMELGYQSANALINYLRSIGVLTITKKEKFYHFVKKTVYGKKYLQQFKKYYSLEDIGIYRFAPSKEKPDLSEEDVYGKDN